MSNNQFSQVLEINAPGIPISIEKKVSMDQDLASKFNSERDIEIKRKLTEHGRVDCSRPVLTENYEYAVSGVPNSVHTEVYRIDNQGDKEVISIKRRHSWKGLSTTIVALTKAQLATLYKSNAPILEQVELFIQENPEIQIGRNHTEEC